MPSSSPSTAPAENSEQPGAPRLQPKTLQQTLTLPQPEEAVVGGSIGGGLRELTRGKAGVSRHGDGPSGWS